MKELRVSRGLVSIVDDDVFEWASKSRWTAQKRKNTFHVARYIGKKYCYLHNLILETPQGFEGNHKDGNGLNNLRENLQAVTHTQNQQSFITLRPDKTSRFRGVFWHGAAAKWAAQIHVNQKKVWLGLHAEEVAAARAYNLAAQKYFGEFVTQNPV